jgi:hypothetical protein
MEGKGATLGYAEWLQQQSETALYYFQNTKINKKLTAESNFLEKERCDDNIDCTSNSLIIKYLKKYSINTQKKRNPLYNLSERVSDFLRGQLSKTQT